ncbi:MAG: DUF3616 domain-containing protein [Oceanicaulis sp.]
MADPATPDATARLTFMNDEALAHVGSALTSDISCLAAWDDTVFAACDETASVEALRHDGDGGYGDHVHHHLADLFDLPAGPDGEMDIEGLAFDTGRLWITGSHSLKRGLPERERDGAMSALENLAQVKRDANRFFLGYIPMERGEDGRARPADDADAPAAALPLFRTKSKLKAWLRGDAHLAPYLDIPCKENGFDIEGLAARGDRVWLGLRGPVIGGFAVVLELALDHAEPGRLKARKLDGGRRYRKHFLDAAGLGVRDLCLVGRDMLVLTGTPLASDGPARVLRWRDALSDTRSGVVDPERLEPVLELPYRGALDHPEGLEVVTGADGERRLMIAYDNPAPERVSSEPPRLVTDLFTLPA